MLREGVAAEAGAGRAGGDGVDADPARRQLLRHVAGHHGEPGLHRPVGGVAGVDAVRQRRAAGDVDDRAAVGEQRQQPLGEEVGPLSSTRWSASNCSSVVSVSGAASAEAGVVDEAVDRRALPARLDLAPQRVGERGEGLAAVEVELQRERLAARGLDRLDGRGGAVGVGAVGDDHAAAAGGGADRGVTADAGAGAGDECDRCGGFHAFQLISGRVASGRTEAAGGCTILLERPGYGRHAPLLWRPACMFLLDAA